jgi:DNA-directed RNA polymerase specialized sigma24 family protein
VGKTLREYQSWRRKRTPGRLPSGFDLEEKASHPMEEEEVRSTVLLSVQALPSKYRDVVQPYYIDGWSLARIKQVYGIPVTTAKMRLHRARFLLERKLRKLMSN